MLIAQLVWIRQLGILHGSYLTAAVTVTAAFMAGLAAGAWIAGRAAGSAASARVTFLLAALGFAAYAAASPALVPTLGAPFHGALFILPPAALAGAVLPLLVAATGGHPASAVRLYAAHALGSAAGPLLAVFILLPGLGVRRTVWCGAALVVSAAAAGRRIASTSTAPASPDDVAPARPGSPARLLALAALGGGFGLALQTVAYRLTALLVTGGTLSGYAMVLTVWLGAGSLAARREASRVRGGFAGPFVVWGAIGVTPWLWEHVPSLLRPLREAGGGPVLACAEWLAVAALTGPAAWGAGALFGRLLAAPSADPAASAGRLLAASTLGALAGGLGAGLVAIPALGLDLFVRGAAALAAVAAAALAFGRARVAWGVVAANAAVAVMFLLPRPDPYALNLGEHNRLAAPGEAPGEVLFERDAALGRIAVTREPGGSMSCRVNGKPDGSSGFVDMLTQAGSAHLALLLHPRPRRVLVIGLGTGVTAGVAALHPEVERVDVVELESAQLDVARVFSAHNYGVMDDPKARIIRDDARRWLRSGEGPWDVILSEPSNLFVAGMVNLFTREFHEAARARLAPGGLLLQWVHYYRIDWEGWRGAVATAAGVHRHVCVWRLPFGDTLITGSDAAPVLDLERWASRLRHPALAENLARLQSAGAVDLARLFLWGPADVRRAVAGVRPCTDDDPWLEFRSAGLRDTAAGMEVNRLRLALQAALSPMPLVRESAARRAELGRAFLRSGTHERARAEYARALALAPGLREARDALGAIPGLVLTQERDLARLTARR